MTKRNNLPMILTAIALLVMVTAILFFVPAQSVWVAFGLAAATVIYFLIMLLIRGQQTREKFPKRWHSIFSFYSYFIIMFVVFTALYLFIVPTIWTIVLMVALMFTLASNYLTIPLAILHKFRDDRIVDTPITEFPKLSIIVPAYNEEKVLSRTIETLLEAYYPNKEIVIVDDGSTDNTYEVARRFVSRGVKVVHRENGGKFAALNTALAFVTGEIVVTLDADSLVTRTALIEVVKGFEDPEVAGIAGTIKVYNPNNLWTRLQALEYLTQIEVVRRAFNNFGCITVAPGAFSAFRLNALIESGKYDPDRLLEDFDLTIKLQKAHKVLRSDSDALAYTEAPDNMGDVYKQRLSWFRGDFQNFWKHRDTFFNPKFGYMHSLTLPYMLISMTLVPFASLIVIATSIAMILSGDWDIVLYAFLVFLALQFFLCLLSIQLGKDDYKLLIYTPLFIIGYKQFLEFTMWKALFDIILGGGTYLKRERVRRHGF